MDVAIVMSIDSAYIRGAAACIASISGNAPGVPLILLHRNLTGDDLDLLRRVGMAVNVDLEFRNLELPTETLPLRMHFSLAMYGRLCIPEACHGFRRVIYLDADVVVKKDLRPLLEANLDGHALAAVRDPWIKTFEVRGRTPFVAGPPLDTTYFNTGVLIFDIEAWRQHEIGAKCIRFANENRNVLLYPDQDAINAVFALERFNGRGILPLSAIWNVPPVSDLAVTMSHGMKAVTPEWSEWERDARIIHFVGPCKPWHKNYPDGANRRLFHQLGASGLSILDADDRLDRADSIQLSDAPIESDQHKLFQLSVQSADALVRNELQQLDAALADDARVVGMDGKSLDKKSFLDEIQSGKRAYRAYELVDPEVTLYGSSAVLAGKARVHVLIQGTEVAGTVQYLKVATKRSGTWKILHWMTTPSSIRSRS